MAIVYQAINKLNSHSYVGVTAKPLAERRYFHINDAKRGKTKIFSKAIRKYGVDAFEWKVLHDYLFPEDAVAAEVRSIEKLKPEYNMTLGGDGVRGLKMSEASKAKMRAAHTPERRAKARETMLRVITPEVRAKSIASLKARKGIPNLKRRGLKHSDETKQKLRAYALRDKAAFIARMKAVPKGRPVICLTDGREFPSATAAAKHYNVGTSSIIEHCLGRDNRLTVGGMTFQYKDAPVIHRASKKCKLNKEKVLEIKNLLGVISQGKIAKMYGVDRVTITDIAVGRSWRNV